MLASFPCAAIFWASYEASKNFLSFLPFFMVTSMSATIAECTQALIRNPFEIIKTNM